MPGIAGFEDAEGALVARIAPVAWETARRTIRRFVIDHSDPSADEQTPSTATLTKRSNGRWQLAADLDEADGVRLSLELNRLLATLRSEDAPLPQRLTMALLQTVRRSVSLADKPAGARPEAVVLRADGATVDGQPIRLETASLHCCDATIRRLILDARSKGSTSAAPPDCSAPASDGASRSATAAAPCPAVTPHHPGATPTT